MDLSLLRRLPIMIHALDAEGLLAEVSDRWLERLGYTREDVIGRRSIELLTPASRSHVVEEAFPALLRDGLVQDVCVDFLRADGRVLHGRLSATVLSGEAGQGFVATVEDLSHEHHLEQLFELSVDMVAILESSGALLLSNPALDRFLVGAEGSVVGSSLAEYVHPEDVVAMRAGIDLLREREPSRALVHRFRRADGAQRWISWTASMSPAEGQVYMILRDVTEARDAEDRQQALDKRSSMARKAESLALFAEGVAHDFNNHLMGVMASTELALLSVQDDDPLAADLRQVRESAQKANELTRQLLDFAGGNTSDLRAVDLSEVVTEVIDLLPPSTPATVRLHRDLSRDLPPVRADLSQLREAVLALVQNAIESLEDRRGEVGMTTGVLQIEPSGDSPAAVGEATGGTHVFIEVRDDGHGMDAETQARCFDPFFTTRSGARGLGLATVAGVVREHGGEVRLRSRPGDGTSVMLVLPSRLEAAEVPSPPPTLPSWRGRGRVLLVDDEDTVRRITRRILEDRGFEVVTARNGQEGVEAFAADPDGYQLVVMDRSMPELDGPDALQAMRRLRPKAPAILTSGFRADGGPAPVADLPDVTYLQKPFGIGALVEAVRTALGN